MGGAIPNGGTGGPPPQSGSPLPFEPTTGTLRFRTVIQDQFAIDFPSGDPSVAQGDTMTNSAVISGDLLSVSNLTPNGQSESDDTSASAQIPTGTVSKSLYAINGNAPTGTTVKPGDTVTYRISYTLPTSDVEQLQLSDYLPLPLLSAAQVTSFDDVISATPPAAGRAQFGPADTFRNYSGVLPVISNDAVANSVTFSYPNFDSPLNQSTLVDLLFTVTVGPQPVADGLPLTNLVRGSESSTNLTQTVGDSITIITVGEPSLRIQKGVVVNDGTGAAFTPGQVAPAGVTFNAPGSATPFTGLINSNGLAAAPIDSNLAGIDAGDRVTFAIVVENLGSSANGAFDVRIRDTLPAGFAIPAGGLNLQARDGTGALFGITSIGSGLFDAAGGIELNDPGPTAGTNPGGLDVFNATNGRNIAIITYDLQATTAVSPNKALVNTATLFNYASIEGGPDFTATDLTDTATVTTRNVTPTKSIVATSEAFTPETGTGSNASPRVVAVGEIIRYRLVVEIPEGTVTNAQIRDQLPNGLTFLNDGTATLALVSDQTPFTSTTPGGATLNLGLGNGPFGSAAFVSGSDSTIAGITPTFGLPTSNVGSNNSTTSDPDSFSTGTDAYFKLGTIVNNDRDSNREYAVIEFNALVDNTTVGSNDAGDNRDNNFQFTTGGTSFATSNNVRARIVEPRPTITKTVTPTSGDAGDTVTYAVVISNPAGANATTGFDTQLLDNLPAFVTLNPASVNVTLAGGASGATDNSSGNTVDVTVGTLPAGGTITITYTATLNANLLPGQLITNTATVTTTSLPGTNGTTVNPTGSSTPGLPGSGMGERTGSGVAPNDLRASAQATATVFPLSPVKSLVSTSEATTTGSNVAIGEVARYRLRIRLPETSLLANVQLQDNLPRGLTYLNDGTTRVAFVSNGAGINSSTLSGAGLNVTGNETNLVSITPTFVLPSNAISGGPFTTGTDPVFSLGDLSNNDRDADQEFVAIEFNALVDNAGTSPADSNDLGDLLNNSFLTRINGATVGSPSNTAPLTVAEPQITNVNKTADLASGDAGDVVTYTVTFSNTGTATAFDTVMTDNMPPSVTLNPASVNVTTTGTVTGVSTAATSGNLVQVDFASIAPGATVTVTYQVTLNLSVAPGDLITNTVQVAYTSLPGPSGTTSNPTGSSTPGSSGLPTGKRDGSGGINDYLASASNLLSVGSPALVKRLITTSEQSTPGTNLTIGELATYELDVTLIEGTIPSITLVDNIPPGTAFVPGSVVVDTTGFNGVLPPVSVTGGNGSGDDLQFDFGTTTVPADNITNNNTFRILYQTRVLNIPVNNGVTPPPRTTLPNTATAVIGGTTITSNTITTTVVEPRVTILKNIIETQADAGQTVRMTLTVQNTGTSTSFDTIVRDVLDTANFDPTTVDFGIAGTDYPADFTPSINTTTGELRYSGGTMAPNATVTFTLSVNLTTTVTPGQTIPNTAQVTQATTLPGVDAGERNSPSLPSTDSLVISASAISGFVYVDANNNGVLDGSETPLGGVGITLQGVDFLGNAVTRTTSTQADGSYSFTQLRPGTYALLEPNQPTGFLDGIDSPGTLFGGLAAVSPGDQIDGIVIPLASNATGINYNFGELPPGSISDLVWDDLNGNGRFDAGEPGLDGVSVAITGIDFAGNSVSSNTTTAGGGLYLFDNLAPGNYTVTFGTLPGYVFTVQNSPVATAATDSSVNPANGQTANFALGVGQNDNTIDAGLYQLVSVGDRIWLDINGDDIQDAGEPGIPGATVTVTNSGPDGVLGNTDDVQLPSTTTGANGIWNVNAPPGLIRVVVSNLPNGLTVQTYDLDGLATPNSATLQVSSGDVRTDVDFGYRGPGSIGDRVWIDLARDGIDNGEPGLPNVTVRATWAGFDGIAGNSDDVTFTNATNSNGNYTLLNLPLGNFLVVVDTTTLPTGYSPTYDLDSVTMNPNNRTLVTLAAIAPNENRADFGYAGNGLIGDRVWLDFNGNGLQDTDEPGLTGVTLTATWAGLDNNFATTGDNQLLATITSTNGNYTFGNLPPGLYRVTVTGGLPAGVTNTGDPDGGFDGTAALSLSANQQRLDIDFGYRGGSSLSGFVYRDYSVDGIRQPAGVNPETGIAGVTITLTGTDIAGDSVTRTTVTGSDGSYSFSGLLSGSYIIRETQPPAPGSPGGLYDGLDKVGTINNVPTGSAPAKNQLAVTIGTGQAGVEYSFGENPPADPFGYVYIDLNNNGIHEPGEPGIAGVAVTVSGTAFAGTPLQRPLTAAEVPGGLTAITDANGRWEFPIIPPGTYSFVETQPPGYLDGREQNADPNGPNTVIVGNDRFDNVELSPFPVRGPFNFGEIAANGVIAGRVYVDQNRNAWREANEIGIANVLIILRGADVAGNSIVRTTVTNATGDFSFGGLLPGTYSLAEAQPVDYIDGYDAAGTNGGVVQNDFISNIVLGANQQATLYSFGEFGLVPTAVTKRSYLASSR